MTNRVVCLGEQLSFPPIETACIEPDGLLAAGGDLSCARLLTAYAEGIFPWFDGDQPILWWSPSERMVLFPEALKVSRSLQKTLRNRDYCVRIDSSFRSVIEACAAPRNGESETWIIPQMVEAYCALHQAGYAHSFEVWEEGNLTGGLYGVSVGKMFWGESMFTRRRDASKIAFVYMARYLASAGMRIIDCQFYTSHLASMGAQLIDRKTFISYMQKQIVQPLNAAIWTVGKLNNCEFVCKQEHSC